jgi:hypothetical protein
MSDYGFQVLTQMGMVPLGSLKTAREVSSFLANTASGNVTTPDGVTPSNGGALVEVLDGLEAPQIFIRSDGLTVWTNYAPSASRSVNFRIRWIVYK